MSKGVSTVEKRAELLAAGNEWPTCVCHGEPKCWNKDATKRAGGHWTCIVTRRARQALYQKTDKGRAARDRHEKTEKRRAQRARRNASNNGRRLYVGGMYLGQF